MFYYYADETGTPEPATRPPAPLFEDGMTNVKLPNGRVVSRISRAIPEWGLYEAILDPTTLGPGEKWDSPQYALSFEGDVGGKTGRVRETAQILTDTLDEARDRKVGELSDYTEQVAYSAFSHTAGPLEFWARSEPLSRFTRGDYDNYLSTRGLDILFDAVQAGIDDGGSVNAKVAAFWNALEARQTGAQPYWRRDIRVFLYDKVTLQLVRDNANQNQWSKLMESQGTFSHQVRAASDRVAQDIDDAYGTSDQAALEAIDVRAASYNWPEHYSGEFAPGSISVSTMMARR